MATKKGGNPSASRPSQLLVPREQALQMLEQQLAVSDELLALAIPNQVEFDTIQDRYHRWNSYNETMLRQIFSTDDERNEYRLLGFGGPTSRDPLSQRIQRLHDDIRYHRSQLESILGKLELYDLAHEAKVISTGFTGLGAHAGSGGEVFIVHGRDEHTKEAAARLVTSLGLEPVVLHERPNQGRTIMQKFMDHAKGASYAIVLLTPDDVGRLAADVSAELEPRARQNVIMELGFFLGVLGSQRVCAVQVGDVVKPSDYDGVLYIPYDSYGTWKFRIAKEMKSAGLQVDLNSLI